MLRMARAVIGLLGFNPFFLFSSDNIQLFFDQITQAILDFIMHRNGSLLSVFMILVNVMLLPMTL